MKLTGLDHFVITTGDLDACLRFYTEVLGMEADASGGRCVLRFGKQKINVHRRPGEFLPAARYAAPGTQDLCLLVEGPLQSAYDEAVARGAAPELGIVERTGARGPMRSFYLRDPDGNLIEISAYE